MLKLFLTTLIMSRLKYCPLSVQNFLRSLGQILFYYNHIKKLPTPRSYKLFDTLIPFLEQRTSFKVRVQTTLDQENIVHSIYMTLNHITFFFKVGFPQENLDIEMVKIAVGCAGWGPPRGIPIVQITPPTGLKIRSCCFAYQLYYISEMWRLLGL